MHYKNHRFFERFKLVLSDPAIRSIYNWNPNRGKFNADKTMVAPHWGPNGTFLYRDTYYGEFIDILALTGGIHEPIEEFAFQCILDDLQRNTRMPTMMELGSYWCFYSLWFLSVFKWDCRLVSLEMGEREYADGLRNLRYNCGDAKIWLNDDNTYATIYKKNKLNLFDKNAPMVHHVRGRASDHDGIGDDGIRNYTLETLCKETILDSMPFVDILHVDIQADEYKVLSASRDFLKTHVGYLVINTHTNEIHASCLALLQACQFVVEGEVDLTETFSEDGIIVARRSTFPALDLPYGGRGFAKRSDLTNRGAITTDEELQAMMENVFG